MKRMEEIDDSQESCGTLWHYIVYQTFQISLGVRLEVQASRHSRHSATYENEDIDLHIFVLGPWLEVLVAQTDQVGNKSHGQSARGDGKAYKLLHGILVEGGGEIDYQKSR